ncbi:MAG: MauE/DoxX family redox-associated membrane protein [Arachnia sp.]
MDYLVVAQLLCAVVLLVSGIAKAAAPAAVGEAAVALRLPRSIIRLPLGFLLPSLELALAALLLIGGGVTLIVAAAATVALFVVYSVIVARAMGFAEPVACACFGSLGIGTIGPRTLVRNIALLVAAISALAGAASGISVPVMLVHAPTWGWLAMTVLSSAVAVLIIGGGSATLPNAASIARLTLRDPAAGTYLKVSGLADRGVSLVFISAGCRPCQRIRPLIAGAPHVVAVVSDASYAAMTPEQLDSLPGVLIDDEGNVADALGVQFSPSAVRLRPGIESSRIVGESRVRDLLTTRK